MSHASNLNEAGEGRARWNFGRRKEAWEKWRSSTDHGHVEHVERLRLDCSKETMKEYGVKDRMEDFFGGLSFEDLSPEDGMGRSTASGEVGRTTSMDTVGKVVFIVLGFGAIR